MYVVSISIRVSLHFRDLRGLISHQVVTTTITLLPLFSVTVKQ
jgi:hypothetical protein